MAFTGAADRVDASGGFGQGETRPQAFTGLDGKGYLIGRTQDRIIEIADISDPDTSTYVSAIIGNPNSMAAHNGSLYVFIGRDLIRFDTPFSDTDTGTDIFTINETPRALTSDGTNLYYIHQNSTLNFLYRIDDLDGTPTAVSLGRVGSSANIRGFVWHDGFFWGVDATTDRLVKIILTTDSNDPHTVENVGSFSQFVGPLTNPQGLGVVNGVGYVSALDNDGSLWELRDFKFTADIADQSWTVGTAVSVDAPATEDGATPITYAISPALPAGVTLDTSTGEISGDPTAETAQADYTLTATDDNSIEATLTFSASVAASGGSLSTPTAPRNLTATPQSNGTSVVLDWDVPSDNGGASISDYEYSDDDGSTFTAIGSADTDYTVTGLDKNTEYDFQVRAVNSEGSGTATATVTATTEATPPNAPTGLSVTVGETTADFTWTAPSDTGGESITSYEVSSDDGNTWTDTGDADLTYQITGLTANTEYDFKVRAVNSEGSGTASSTVTETTNAAAVTPTLGWEVPSETVGNTFSATLTSNVALDAAPTVGDLRLRDDDNSDPVIQLNSTNTTITAIAGTNNYLIELDLTGTYDDDYTIRVNGNTVEYNGAYVNAAQLASAVFSIDSSIGANNAPSFSESSYAFTDIAIAVNTVVGTVAATDADDDTLSYSLTGTDASNFAIDSDGEITVATALTNSTTYNFNVVADDQTDTTSVAVTVTAVAAVAALSFGVSTISNQAWVVGTDVDLTLPEATGGTGARVYSLTPTLPQGTAFTAGTRALGGIPTAVFVSTPFTYTATDEDGNTVELTFTLAVAVAPPSLYNTFIFRDCVNYRNNGGRVAEHGNASNVIRAVADNDRETFSTETDYDVDIEVDSEATRVDAFYLVSKGVDTHAGTPTGGTGTGWTARTVPASVDNIRGESVSTVVDGLQYDLFLLDTHFTATSVRLQFTGTGVEIYEVMLLEIVQEINATYSDFLGYAAEQVNRTGRVERSPIGGLSVVDSTREKRDVEMTVYIRPSGRTLIQSPDEFLYLLEANPRLTLAESFSENPSLLYPAIVGSLEIPVPYHSSYKPLGYDMTVLVRER